MFTHGDAMLCLARIRAKDAYLMEHSMNVAILLANFGTIWTWTAACSRS